MTATRTTRDLCQDCWQAAHPDEYCPELGRYGTCTECGATALITRSRIADEDCANGQHHPDRNAPTPEYPIRCFDCGIVLSEVRTIDLTPTWLGILPALLDIVRNGTTVETHKTADEELRRMAGLADAHVATRRKLAPITKALREALDNLGGEEVEDGYALDDPGDAHLIAVLRIARDLASRF